MKAEKAIQRLGWRFSEATKKNNSFTINQNDIDALVSLAEFVDKNQQKFQDNQSFAKLYIYTAMKIMENDGSTIFENNHRRKIGNLLKMPMDDIILNLKDSLNDSERYEMIKEATGDDLRHPVLISKEKQYENIEKIKEALITDVNKKKLLGEIWNFEDVKTGIISEVNAMLKK